MTAKKRNDSGETSWQRRSIMTAEKHYDAESLLATEPENLWSSFYISYFALVLLCCEELVPRVTPLSSPNSSPSHVTLFAELLDSPLSSRAIVIASNHCYYVFYYCHLVLLYCHLVLLYCHLDRRERSQTTHRSNPSTQD